MAKKKGKPKTEPKAKSKAVKEAETFEPSAKEESLPQNILLMGEHTQANKEIYIFQKTYKEIRQFTKNKTEIESGGILVGDAIEKFGKTNIMIRGFIEAKHSEGTPTTLKFTHETWKYVHTMIDKLYPDMKIVGWIHTHPSFGIFLSEYDKFIQGNFFNDKNQIAYVVDPIQKTEGFFFWKNEEIERCKGFYIFDDIDATIDISPEEEESTAAQMIEKLSSRQRFAIVRADRPYTEKELLEAGLPLTLTREEILDIIYVRYMLFTTQYRKYMPVTVARGISEESVAALSEAKDTLTGIEIVEDSTRVYDYPIAFASLIGYTGKVSSEDLSELRAKNSRYNSESIVGKSGIEKVYEEMLQGSDGQETVYVDRFGKVLQIDESQTILPTAGSNVHLTIDADLQMAVYKILEQRIAGVLEHVIIDADSFDSLSLEDRNEIKIPIINVYNAGAESLSV